jgi:transcriptional/translational regulatory protein YebC/TACO1
MGKNKLAKFANMEEYPHVFQYPFAALQEKGFETMSAEISMVAEAEVALDNEGTAKTLKLVDKLEENDDVQNVYTNITVPEGFEAE